MTVIPVMMLYLPKIDPCYSDGIPDNSKENDLWLATNKLSRSN